MQLSQTDSHCSWVLLWMSTKKCNDTFCVPSNNGEMIFTKNPERKAGEVAQWLNTQLSFFQRTRVLFPALTQSSSQVPGIPVSENLTPPQVLKYTHIYV